MTPFALLLSTLAVCSVSGVLPLVHAEFYLASVSAVTSDRLAVPLILIGAVGQMIGKSAMYLCGRGLVHLPGGRIKRRLAEAERRFKDRRGLGSAVLFMSAATGLPPFYLVTVASGMLKVPFPQFLLLGLCGRVARFALVVLSPHLVRHLWLDT